MEVIEFSKTTCFVNVGFGSRIKQKKGRPETEFSAGRKKRTDGPVSFSLCIVALLDG